MKKTFIIFSSIALALVCACNPFNEAHTIDIQELAYNADGVGTVGKDGGQVDISVYANAAVHIGMVESVDWARLGTEVLDGDGVVSVEFDENPGMRRMVRLALRLDGTGLKDTIAVRQEGTVAYLECAAPYKAVNGSEDCDIRYDLTTNLSGADISCNVEYVSGGENWISAPVISDRSPTTGIVNTSSVKNVSDVSRKARITLSHVDGWGEKLGCDLYVTQSDKDGAFGISSSFSDVRGLGTPEGYAVTEDLLLDGVVISDYRSRNMDENTNVSHDVVDSLYSLSTAYIVSEDGAFGFRLKFSSHEENALSQGTRLQLNLNGTVVTKEENPVRYTISNVNGTNMVGSEAGLAEDIPVKRKTIDALTDDDIYTFVSLQNTEFIFKYGTYADVYENYTLKSALNGHNANNNGRMDGWATLLVDADGHSIYAPVNMLCLWRRGRVPEGAGETRGIIVHNRLPKVGDVGRYQIRVIDESGFAQAETGSAYEEYCIWDGRETYKHSAYSSRNPRYNHDQKKPTESIIPSSDILDYSVPTDAAADPVVPRGELFLENRVSANGAWPHNNGEYYCRPSLIGDEVKINDNITVQPVQGESETYFAYNARVNVKGWYNFDGDGNLVMNADGTVASNGIRYEISTRNLSGSGLLFSYDFAAGSINVATSKTFPAHWCVEYSVDGGQTYTIVNDYISGKPYVHLRSLPWWDATVNGTMYKTCSAAGMGFSQHAVLLPADVLGKDLLKVRLRPYDATITTLPIAWDGDNETAVIQKSTSASNQIKIGSAKFSVKK